MQQFSATNTLKWWNNAFDETFLFQQSPVKEGELSQWWELPAEDRPAVRDSSVWSSFTVVSGGQMASSCSRGAAGPVPAESSENHLNKSQATQTSIEHFELVFIFKQMMWGYCKCCTFCLQKLRRSSGLLWSNKDVWSSMSNSFWRNTNHSLPFRNNLTKIILW